MTCRRVIFPQRLPLCALNGMKLLCKSKRIVYEANFTFELRTMRYNGGCSTSLRDYFPDEHLLASSLLGLFAPMHTSNINKPRLDWLKRESTINCKAQDLDHRLKKKVQERTGIDIQLIGLFFFFSEMAARRSWLNFHLGTRKIFSLYSVPLY